MKLSSSFFLQDIHHIARSLLGARFIRQLSGERVLSGKIVEVEVYTQENDPSSHSFHGPNKRNAVMFGPPGRLYVYFTYGMHYCCNIVCGPEGKGDAILIRALEPVDGIEDMMLNRFGHVQEKRSINDLTNGPAKLCQALQITKNENGCDLEKGDIRIETLEEPDEKEIGVSTRIGISRGKEFPWRYYIKKNTWVSKAGKGTVYFE